MGELGLLRPSWEALAERSKSDLTFRVRNYLFKALVRWGVILCALQGFSWLFRVESEVTGWASTNVLAIIVLLVAYEGYYYAVWDRDRKKLRQDYHDRMKAKAVQDGRPTLASSNADSASALRHLEP